MNKWLLAVSCLTVFNVNAQQSDALYQEVARVDAEFFEAFNTCDIATMAAMFSRELEFYHDTGGVSGYESTVAVTRANCDRQLGLERTLVPGSMRVYPVKDFGAIQKGNHTFCHVENGKNDCGTFEFVHVWKKTDESWQLYRVVSYGH